MTQLLTATPLQVRPAAARAEGLTKCYRRGAEVVRALDGVELTLERGEFAAVIGPSGSGKSTLMNLLGCMDTPSAGRLWIAGEEVAGLGDGGLTRMRRQHIGFIFQQFHLLPTLTVLENVLLPSSFGDVSSDISPRKREGSESAKRRNETADERRWTSMGAGAIGVHRRPLAVPFLRSVRAFARFALSRQNTGAGASHLGRARELLDRVGLSSRLHHLPSQLSGGEMQRVAIARSLINEPALLLADEPTGNLDTEASDRVLEIFRDLNADSLTVVLVTHNPELAARTRRVIRLRDGRIVEDGRI